MIERTEEHKWIGWLWCECCGYMEKTEIIKTKIIQDKKQDK
jgi:hypothetical protein